LRRRVHGFLLLPLFVVVGSLRPDVFEVVFAEEQLVFLDELARLGVTAV
jgi:hypothetical protein